MAASSPFGLIQVEAELSCDINCSDHCCFPAFPPRISRAEAEGPIEEKVNQLIMSVWVEGGTRGEDNEYM